MANRILHVVGELNGEWKFLGTFTSFSHIEKMLPALWENKFIPFYIAEADRGSYVLTEAGYLGLSQEQDSDGNFTTPQVRWLT